MPAPSFPSNAMQRIVFTQAGQIIDGTASDRFSYRFGTAHFGGAFNTVVEKAEFERTGKTDDIPNGAGGTLAHQHRDLGWKGSFTLYLGRGMKLSEKGDLFELDVPNTGALNTGTGEYAATSYIFQVESVKYAGAVEGFEKYDLEVIAWDSINASNPSTAKIAADGTQIGSLNQI